MPDYRLPYGKTHLTFTLPAGLDVQLLAPREVPAAADPLAEVARALDRSPFPRTREGPAPDLSPFPSPLRGGVTVSPFPRREEPVLSRSKEPVLSRSKGGRGVRSAAVAINDKTRLVPHEQLLPPLLARLEALGLPRAAITLVIATGTHLPMRPDEYGQVIPAGILGRYPVVCHNVEDEASLVYRGQTAAGTPVWVNRAFAEADLRIVVGNIEPHQFAGFSGGVKTAAIGLTGKATIHHNHAMMTEPGAEIGRYDGNPVRQDIEEIGRLIGVHYALNAVLNGHKQIVHALAGDPVEVMQAGIPQVRTLCQVDVPTAFDLMLVSPGGYPKDINLYQAQKALGHATLVMKPGGAVILAAACPEGTGSASYERWMLAEGMTSYGAVFERFRREGFQVGPHKAFQIARDASRVRVLFKTEMAPDFVRRLLLTPISDPNVALAQVLYELPPDTRIGVMPWANATIPVLKTN
ncbi:MAG: hypothetical protein AUK03_15350 [Anaerolineae bacterium CG2_30_64_16]|nr:MAG: hypothetical protein AUK03_15350 [Anaerolineae bacterium CG2_30_64_16]